MMLGSSAMGIASPTIPSFLKAAASAQQVLKVLAIGSSQQRSEKSTSEFKVKDVIGNLSINGVSFYYPSRPTITVLNQLSLEIPANKTTAIVGHSGSGKSTIVGLLERWYDPTEGSITLDGMDLQQINISSLRRQIALVQQVRCYL
jgi:ATP-binding cassette subfamily B (MDR/TAP) protein 1